MIRVTPIAAGSGYEYLTRDLAQTDDYYLRGVEQGEAPGRWLGAGSAPLLALDGAVTEDQMRALFGLGVDPNSGAPLGRAWAIFRTFDQRIEAALAAEPGADQARKAVLVDEVRRSDPKLFEKIERALSREPDATAERRREIESRIRGRAERHAVAGFDVTLSAPKSVSLLAVGLDDVGRSVVMSAHHVAVAAALAEFERVGLFSRAGQGGVRQVDVQAGMIAAAFDHRTNRNGEPQIHTHVAVANKVLCDDGKWRTLDSQALHAHAQACGWLYSRVLESELSRTFGVRWVDHGDGFRDIDGIPGEVRAMFSTRTLHVMEQYGQLVAEYVERHGVQPSRRVARELRQRAKVENRPAKQAAESTGSAVDRWRAVASSNGVDLVAVADAARDRAVPVAEWAGLAARVVARLEVEHASYTAPNVLAAVRACAPVDVSLTVDEYVARTQAVADEILGLSVRLTPVAVAAPAVLCRADGASQYVRAGSVRHSSGKTLDRERELLRVASDVPVWRFDGDRVLSAVGASGCSTEQGCAVVELLAGTSRVAVLVGPAGTGKTYTMATVVAAVHAEGRQVIGLTLAQAAAQVLETETGMSECHNVARFRASVDAGSGSFPQRGLIVVDEAGMMPTAALSWIFGEAERADCRVLLVGDHAQLAAPEAGGAFRLLAARQGFAELAEVRRFRESWEREASLRVRDGDVSVLGEYDLRGRIVDGGDLELRERVGRDWLAEVRRGRTAVVLTGTNEQAARLAGELRSVLVDEHRVESVGVLLHDGNVAGVGDRVVARRNDWSLRSASGSAVINRGVWQVVERGDDGSLRAARVDVDGHVLAGDTVLLPRGYVAEHVELAYAGTVHSAQGRTVESSFAFVDNGAGWSREALYVALSRGRGSNRAYVTSIYDQVPDEQRRTVDPLEVLADVMERQSSNVSAVEVLEAELVASRSMGRLGSVWADAVAFDVGLRVREAVGEVDPSAARRLTRCESWPSLVAACRAIELDGHDLRAVVRAAAAERELPITNAARVLEWRIDERTVRPPDVASPVVHHADFVEFLGRVREAIDDRLAELAVTARQTGAGAEHGLSADEYAIVAGWREWAGVTADVAGAGERPHPHHTEQLVMWRHANELASRAPGVDDERQRVWQGALAEWERDYPDMGEAIRSATYEWRRAVDELSSLDGRLYVARSRHVPRNERVAHAATVAATEGDRDTQAAVVAERRRAVDEAEAAQVERGRARARIAHLFPQTGRHVEASPSPVRARRF